MPAGKRPPGEMPAVVRRTPDEDRPRWALVGGIVAVGLAVGILWPRACGLRFTADEEAAAASGSVTAEPPPPPPSVEPPPPPSSATPVPSSEPPGLATVTIGKATLIHCQDPPAAELKPSKCGEHNLDAVVLPKLELLSACPAVANVSGRLQVNLDLNFKAKTLKVTAGRSSALHRGTRRDDKLIEPILACLRTSMKEVVTATDAPARDHARYVLFYPVTLAPIAGATPAPSASVNEKSVTGVAKVEVDAAIVRDAPNTSGQPIGRLSRGTKVSIVGTSANWYHVKFGDNDAQDGWIFRTNIGK